MLRAPRFPTWLALAGLALAGCSDAPRITDTYVATAYTPNEFGRGVARRDVLTEIRGDPFGQGQAAFVPAVLGLIAEHEPGPQPATFTATPDASANPAYRVLLLFDAPRAVNALSVCGQPPAPAAAPEGTLYLTAAFCRGSTTLTKVSGEVAELSGVDDPKFDALLSQVLQALFPLRADDGN